jgi:hypothetical protein
MIGGKTNPAMEMIPAMAQPISTSSQCPVYRAIDHPSNAQKAGNQMPANCRNCSRLGFHWIAIII